MEVELKKREKEILKTIINAKSNLLLRYNDMFVDLVNSNQNIRTKPSIAV